MPNWLLTILMLRDDQLIRWGRVNFWIALIGALLFAFFAGISYYLVNTGISEIVTRQTDTLFQDASILSMDSKKEKHLLLSCQMVAKTLNIVMGVLRIVPIVLACMLPVFLQLGFISLRLRKLGLELQHLKKDNHPLPFESSNMNQPIHE